MKSVDYTETLWESYVGFNFMNRVEEYQLRLKNRTAIYYAYGGWKFDTISYSSNHSFLYLSGYFTNSNYSAIYNIQCGNNYQWYYWIIGEVSDLKADKYN